VGARINAALREAAAKSPYVHLVDWKAAVDADTTPGGPNVLTSDGIHPTPLGQAWLAHHIRDAVDRDCR
jgi:lysophospholipase L1-like esterase